MKPPMNATKLRKSNSMSMSRYYQQRAVNSDEQQEYTYILNANARTLFVPAHLLGIINNKQKEKKINERIEI